MLRTGYILRQQDDLIWFILLPFVAIAAALACQQWLPAVALASITLIITAPHHFVTWLRTYGIAEEWQRFKTRLILGPICLFLLILSGLKFAPWTLFLVIIMWDHQHSIMQQYGFARIYDFKAGTGTPSTARYDLFLGWILYINLFLTSPLFTKFWVRELFRWKIPVAASTVETIQLASWTLTTVFLVLYTLHVLRGIAAGYPVNPLKLVFLAASYFLWYFTSWHTDSILVFGIAHRLMHGLQYIVIVYWYIRRKEESKAEHPDRVAVLVTPGHIAWFLVACVMYAFLFQLIAGQPLERFGFGVVNFVGQLNYDQAYHVYAETVVSLAALTHYYFDSFIWKVRDERTQGGL